MKHLNRLLTAIILFALVAVGVTPVDATSATTYTTTFNRKREFVITQDAYLPDQTILNLGLDGPSDLHIDKDDLVYISDTGNQRIAIYDPGQGVIVDEITYPEFQSPRGIFITEDDELYVADPSAEAVFRFNIDGTFIQKYTKPDSVSLQATKFEPKKVAVDNQDNMYIVAEGVFDGLIQMSSSGEFLGYFATNEVVLTPTQQFQKLIFTDEQLDQISNFNPPSFSNVYVDPNGIKYTTSIGDDVDSVKKHNTNGSSSIDTNCGVDLGLIDVYTDNYGTIYTAGEDGYIYIFTSDGQFIFAFGTDVSGEDVAGLYSELNSIAVDSKGTIWTLDGDKAFIQSYTPTDYSVQIYEALNFYKSGKYTEAVNAWEEVLKLNQLSVLAHNEIGRNLFSQGEFELALEHFELAGNRFYYSESYWEVRNVDIQQTLPIVLLGMLVLLVVWITVKVTNKKYEYLAAPQALLKRVTSKKLIDDFLFQFTFYKHPLDSFFYLNRKQRGSYFIATFISILFCFIYVAYTLYKGFIFQFVEAADMDLGAIVLGFFSIIILFIFCNYLVTSINDGEGSLGEIYKGVMYSLSPLAIAYIVITYLSYYVTFNEVILLQLVGYSGMIGTGILIFLTVQELHNYTIRETIKSFLLTLLFMVIAGILFAFIQIMGDQLIQFLIGIFKEAFRNVF